MRVAAREAFSVEGTAKSGPALSDGRGFWITGKEWDGRPFRLSPQARAEVAVALGASLPS
jgi:hypothetical protein